MRSFYFLQRINISLLSGAPKLPQTGYRGALFTLCHVETVCSGAVPHFVFRFQHHAVQRWEKVKAKAEGIAGSTVDCHISNEKYKRMNDLSPKEYFIGDLKIKNEAANGLSGGLCMELIFALRCNGLIGLFIHSFVSLQ